jgi:hypothetical protein
MNPLSSTSARAFHRPGAVAGGSLLTLFIVSCGPDFDADSNLCGEIDAPLGASGDYEVVVATVNDGMTACRGGDSGGPSWYGTTVAEPVVDGRYFDAEVEVGSYGVEAWDGSGEFRGCTAADVPDASTCAADIVVELQEYVPVDKPNLYLYPEVDTELSVRLPGWRRITAADPLYPPQGWTVEAHPDGRLTTAQGPRDFLFYEILWDAHRFQREEGWCAGASWAQATVEDSMADLGFLENEIADFAAAWDGGWPDAAFVTIYPQVEDLALLRIDPEPERLLRAWFLVEEGCQPVRPPHLERVERTGYHAAEWGVAFGEGLEADQIMVEGWR